MIFQKKNLLVMSSLGFVIVGIALVSVVDRATANNNSTDIRARAAVTKSLTVNATVVSTDPIKGVLTITDLYFTDESRSGDAKNLGSWLVTAPGTFNFSTIAPGSSVVIGLNATLFNVSAHTLTATSITRTP